MTRLKSRTQRELAYDHIRRMLIDGTLSTGARLSPTALAKEIGMSHTPVREAISQLQSDGFVVQTPHQGAFVRQPTRQELVEIIEIRTTLECNAAAQAARRIGREQLREFGERWHCLAGTIEAYKTASDAVADRLGTDWILADLQFHMTLLRAAGNRLAMRIIEDYRIMTRMFGRRSTTPEVLDDGAVDIDKNLEIHRGIYEAVGRRDPKAARRAMAVHMRIAGKSILAWFDSLHRPSDTDSGYSSEYPDALRKALRAIERGEPSDD